MGAEIRHCERGPARERSERFGCSEAIFQAGFNRLEIASSLSLLGMTQGR